MPWPSNAMPPSTAAASTGPRSNTATHRSRERQRTLYAGDVTIADRRSPRREPLTRLRILEAALALVDREGADALTMRRLGDEVGAAAMSLYNHIPGRDALLDGLSEVLVGGIPAEPFGNEPREQLRRFASGIRGVALAHPDAFRLVGMRPLHTPQAFRPVEVALGALRAFGLADDEAVHGYRALVSFARGYALAEIGGFTLEAAQIGPQAPVDPDDLRAEGLPNLAELSSHLLHPEHEAAFAFGLDSILDGLEARAVALNRGRSRGPG